MIGYEDRLLPDGGDGRSFTSLWWRTWRYVELTITTAGEALVVDDLYGTFTGYPFKQDITFAAPALPELNECFPSVGVRPACVPTRPNGLSLLRAVAIFWRYTYPGNGYHVQYP